MMPAARRPVRLLLIPVWLVVFLPGMAQLSLAGDEPTQPAVPAEVVPVPEVDPRADLPPGDSIVPELVATGMELASGLALNETGDLFVANYRRNGTIGRVARDGTAGIFRDLRAGVLVEEQQPRINGLKIDGEGRLIGADLGTGRLLRISADGTNVEVLADRCEGKRFAGIGDVALDGNGNIYFTDSAASSVKNPVGAVYRYDVQTTKVAQVAAELAAPTGVAVSPDRNFLCVAESQRYRALIFNLDAVGKADNRRVLIDFPTETRGEIIGGATPPGGMVFDAADRLYVAMDTGGVINVVEVPSGKLVRQYKAGGNRAANCHFHAGNLYVSVAAKEAVFRLKLGIAGYDYAGARNAILPTPPE